MPGRRKIRYPVSQPAPVALRMLDKEVEGASGTAGCRPGKQTQTQFPNLPSVPCSSFRAQQMVIDKEAELASAYGKLQANAEERLQLRKQNAVMAQEVQSVRATLALGQARAQLALGQVGGEAGRVGQSFS